MNKILNHLLDLLKGYLGLFLSISFGVFLFILFFQPFPVERFDFDNRLIFIAGLAMIIFVLLVCVQISISLLFDHSLINDSLSPPTFLRGFGYFVLSSLSFAFYLRYVGKVSVTFYIMLRILLICMVVPIVWWVFDTVYNLRRKNESLIKEKKAIQKQIEQYEEDNLNKSIEFVSENGTETFTLQVAEVAFIRSADNYVEIVYWEVNGFKKKLIRNTMKHIEQQIKVYSNFIRCHRICIINTHFMERLDKSFNTHWISIKGYDEKLPVSRQYLLKLKEAI